MVWNLMISVVFFFLPSILLHFSCIYLLANLLFYMTIRFNWPRLIIYIKEYNFFSLKYINFQGLLNMAHLFNSCHVSLQIHMPPLDCITGLPYSPAWQIRGTRRRCWGQQKMEFRVFIVSAASQVTMHLQQTSLNG